jgi:hypothetical protein
VAEELQRVETFSTTRTPFTSLEALRRPSDDALGIVATAEAG